MDGTVTDTTLLAHPDQRVSDGVTDRAWMAGLAFLAILVGLPYAVMGPKLFLDDWWVLRNRHFTGVLSTAGHAQLLARPGAWLTFTVEFGLLGRHPLILYLVQTALNAAIAALLFAALRNFVSRPLAAGTSAAWVLLPDHGSLAHWASAMQAVMCLLLLLGGTVLLARVADQGGAALRAAAIALLAGSVLCYEASLPVALAVLFVVPALRGGRPDLRLAAAGIAVLGAVGGWMFLHTQYSTSSAWGDIWTVPLSHFGEGVARSRLGGAVLLCVALSGLLVAAVRLIQPSRRPDTGQAEWLVVAGVGTIAAGTLAFARFPLQVVGMNDRANVIGAVGAAMVWVGLAAMLWRVRALFWPVLAVWLALVVPARMAQDRDYHRAGLDAERLLAALHRDFPNPTGEIVIGPAAPNRHGVVALTSDWDTSAALQLDRGDPTLRARITKGLADYLAAPGPRFDLRTERRVP